MRGIGLLGKGEDPLDPAHSRERAEIVEHKLEGISNVVITQYQGTPILVRHVAKVVEGHQPRLGIIGRDEGGISENDVVQGIILMRKYEKSLEVSGRGPRRRSRRFRSASPSSGDENPDFQPADRARTRNNA